jgi:hypothetical protein
MSYDPATGMSFGEQKETAIAEFYNEAVQNNFKTGQEGRPIFDDKVFIRIMIPGDRHTVVERLCKEEDKHRFPVQWARFQLEESQTADGTPLEQWPMMTPALVRTFKASNVPTVEALANVADGNLHNLGMGAREWRDRAIAYLNRAKEGAIASKLQAENEDLRAELDALKANVADLVAAQARKDAEE